LPELDWVGRRQVLDLAAKIPSPSLRRVPEASLPPDSGNEIVHGDNLRALKALLPSYREQVKLVFIDPPYNADDERWVYEDRYYAPETKGWFGEVGPEDPFRQDKWLCMMYPRLALLRELLRPDGTTFISIGDNALHLLRALMDEVFGARNFLGCAVWKKGPPSDGGRGFLASVHNYVVVYARDRDRVSPAKDLTTWWTTEEFGDSEEARRELEALFPEKRDLFAIPKPVRLVRNIVEAATDRDARDIVLDCFAGSGTTAHAVLEQNARDGGDRRFVLVEMGDYAETLTAGRVRRAIRSRTVNTGADPRTGFGFYELDGSLPGTP